MASRDDNLERLHHAIRELTEPRETTTAIPGWTPQRNRKLDTHRATHDPLLTELRNAIYPGGTTSDDGGSHGVPGSRSPARDAAIDRLVAIEQAVYEWITRLRIPPRDTAMVNLRALLGEAGVLDDDMLGWLTLDAQRWATWARVVTGWQTPPFTPRAPCPACETMGALRIRYSTEDACCLQCGADWRKTDGSIYILGDHVRHWNGESA